MDGDIAYVSREDLEKVQYCMSDIEVFHGSTINTERGEMIMDMCSQFTSNSAVNLEWAKKDKAGNR